MMRCHSNRYNTGRQGRQADRRQASPRLGAVLCLFALVTVLILPVVHTLDLPAEVAVTSSALGAQLLPHHHRTPTVLSTATAAPHGKSHDSFLCPLCQLLTQVRQGLAPMGSRIGLLRLSIPIHLDGSQWHAGPDLAVSAPRAPPFLP
jgi:hypothetical protein